MSDAINLSKKLRKFHDIWSPKIVAEFNDIDIMVVKGKGEFPWHSHPETDDLFLVLEGTLNIELRDKVVKLNAGEMYIVPKGVEHRPTATTEAHILLIEPKGTPNTGDPNTAATKSKI